MSGTSQILRDGQKISSAPVQASFVLSGLLSSGLQALNGGIRPREEMRRQNDECTRSKVKERACGAAIDLRGTVGSALYFAVGEGIKTRGRHSKSLPARHGPASDGRPRLVHVFDMTIKTATATTSWSRGNTQQAEYKAVCQPVMRLLAIKSHRRRNILFHSRSSDLEQVPEVALLVSRNIHYQILTYGTLLSIGAIHRIFAAKQGNRGAEHR